MYKDVIFMTIIAKSRRETRAISEEFVDLRQPDICPAKWVYLGTAKNFNSGHVA